MSKSKTKFDPTSIKLSGIHVMKNSDKGFHESWEKPRGRSIGCLPHPFTLCLLGIKNRGKTNLIVNIFCNVKRQRNHLNVLLSWALRMVRLNMQKWSPQQY